MANINLNINVLDNADFPTLSFIDTTDLSISVNGGLPTLADNSIIEVLPQDTEVTIEVTKTGYDTYIQSLLLTDVDKTIYIILSASAESFFINIEEDCHTFTINNTGTTVADDVTFSITDLDRIAITGYTDIALTYGSSYVFTSTTDNVYIVTIKDADLLVLREYVIIDYCDIRQCISDKILDILCECSCQEEDCDETLCEKDFNMKRINLLQFDLFNRINKEYRLNSYYNTIDDLKVNELKTTQDLIDKLNEYCDTCDDDTTSNSDCGCS